MAATDVKNDAGLGANLVSYWELEESSGTRVDAVTGTGNDLSDNNTVTSATGKQGTAADFELSNSEFLRKTSPTTVPIANNFTIAFWLKAESLSATMFPFEISDGADTNNNSRCILTADGAIRFGIASLNEAVSSAGVITTGTWYHYVGVKRSTGTGIELYIDGTSVATHASTAAAPTGGSQYITIGARRSPVNLPYDGLIDEFGIWSKALSTGEISDLYNSGAGIPYEAAATTNN